MILGLTLAIGGCGQAASQVAQPDRHLATALAGVSGAPTGVVTAPKIELILRTDLKAPPAPELRSDLKAPPAPELSREPDVVPPDGLKDGAEPKGELPDGAPQEAADFGLSAPSIIPNQILVGIKAGMTLNRKIQSHGTRILSTVDVGTTYQTIELPPGVSVEQGMQMYERDPAVDHVAPNRVYGVSETLVPNDPMATEQWGLKQIRGFEAVGRNVDARHLTVAVLDTGVDYNHPDLAGRVMIGWNFAEKNKDVLDHFGHGTHVAGIIAAASNNGQGIAGVCGTCKIMAIKVLGNNGEGSTSTVLEGIKYAADYGVQVINLSLGSSDTTIDVALSQAISYARSRNVIVVAAAGNNRGGVGSPANDPGAIAVASTSKFLWWEYLSWFSNRGPKVELSAPGGGIWSLAPLTANKTGRTGYAKLSGTSMAAPFVAGEAALILASHPGWGPDAVHQRLVAAVDEKGSAGRDPSYGFGRIRLDLAIQ